MKRIERLCAVHGVALPAAALQFPLGHPAVVAAIPRAVRSEQVVANVENARRAIPSAFWTALRDEGHVDPACPLPVAVS